MGYSSMTDYIMKKIRDYHRELAKKGLDPASAGAITRAETKLDEANEKLDACVNKKDPVSRLLQDLWQGKLTVAPTDCPEERKALNDASQELGNARSQSRANPVAPSR